MEDAIELTSVDGAFGRILCIGYVFGDQEIKIIFDEHINERIVLESFWKLVQEADLVVGHKIVDSDLLFYIKDLLFMAYALQKTLIFQEKILESSILHGVGVGKNMLVLKNFSRS